MTPNNDPIPGVRITIKGSNVATLTNNEGRFILDLPAGNYKVTFTRIGFATLEKRISVQGNTAVNIFLQPQDVQLEEVSIRATKKDPAYAIIKQVIQNKRRLKRQYETFQEDLYIKVSLREDTLPSLNNPGLIPLIDTHLRTVNLLESQYTSYFQQPEKYKSIVHAYRDYEQEISQNVTVSFEGESGDLTDYKTDFTNPYLFIPGGKEATFDFLDNLLIIPRLGDRSFVSPFHSTSWQLTYKYKLEEKYYENGRVHYRISVRPRNSQGALFRGEMVIVDGEWAIKSVKFKVMPSSLVYYAAFELTQEFQKVDDQYWALKEESYLYSIKEGKRHLYGSTFTSHSNPQWNLTYPRSFFRNELIRVEKEAFEQDSSSWEALRPMALSEEETEFVDTQDSIMAFRSSAEYLREQDSIFNRLGILDFLFNGIAYRDRARKMRYRMDAFTEQLQPFGVGGYRHQLGGSIRKTFQRGTQLYVRGQVDYGFNNQDIKGNGRVRFTYAPRRFASAYIRGGDVYNLVNNFDRFVSILSRSNFINKRFIGFGHRIEVINGLYLSVGVDFADRRAIDQLDLAEWTEDLFGELNTPRVFDPYKEFITQIKLTYTPGQRYYMEPYRKVLRGSDWPTFTVLYKKAIPDVFQSDLNYDYLSLQIEHEIRLATLGFARYKVYGGTFLQANNIRFTDFRFIRGSDPYFFVHPLLAFNLLGPTISTQNAFLEGHYHHDFAGTLLDKVPLIKRTKLELTAGIGTLLVEDGNFFHTEAYVGLNYPFRIRKQRMKVNVNWVNAYTNLENAIASQIKFGFTFYNPQKQRWEY